MKAILEFDLNDMDDRLDHLRCVKSLDMALVLWDIVYNMRKGAESEAAENDLNAFDVIDKIFDRICDKLDEQGVIIDDLVV